MPTTTTICIRCPNLGLPLRRVAFKLIVIRLALSIMMLKDFIVSAIGLKPTYTVLVNLLARRVLVLNPFLVLPIWSISTCINFHSNLISCGF